MASQPPHQATLEIGPSAILAYTRLSYTMWHALAEFIDNSTQSRTNYGSVIDDVLKAEGSPLIVDIVYNRVTRELTIEDNSIGMSKEKLIEALRVAYPTNDSRGRSRYGMGMKTAACWIGKTWKVVTSEWSTGEEWTATIDVTGIASHGAKVPLELNTVSTDKHGTKIIISDLHRNFRRSTEETIKEYLGSMYRFDIAEGRLKLTYNNAEIPAPHKYEMDTDSFGKEMIEEFTHEINGKKISGWFGILAPKRGGRKHGGFSKFQNRRQIVGYPSAWKPKSIFGGVDDEGANNLIAQRLTGLIEFDEKFHVSHTKDAIHYEGDEEKLLEDFLAEKTKVWRDYASRRRSPSPNPWARDKLKALVSNMKQEFESPEFKDALNTTVLPPLSTILANNKQQVSTLAEGEKLGEFDILPGVRVVVSEQERSEHEPYVTIEATAESGKIHVIINGLHSYYGSLDGVDAVDECIRQYIYDAVAEFQTSKLTKPNPDSVRRLKDALLRTKAVQVENAVATAVAMARSDDDPGDD